MITFEYYKQFVFWWVNSVRKSFFFLVLKNEGILYYNVSKTLSFFPSTSHLCFGNFFKKINFFSLAFIGNGHPFYYLNSFRTFLGRKHVFKINSLYCDIPFHISRVVEYYSNCANVVSFVQGLEDKKKSMRKELNLIHKQLPISFSRNHSSLSNDISFKELKFLESLYISCDQNWRYMSYLSLFWTIPCYSLPF